MGVKFECEVLGVRFGGEVLRVRFGGKVWRVRFGPNIQGTSLIINSTSLGPYSRLMPSAL